MQWLQEFLRTKYVVMGLGLEISALQCFGAIISLVVGFALGKILSYIMESKFKKLAEKTESTADDYLAESAGKPLSLLCQISGVYFALKIIGLPTKAYNFEQLADNLYHIFLALDVTWFILKFVDAFHLHMESRAQKQGAGMDSQVVKLITKSIKTFIWLLAGVLILQNLGYSISGLLAGLGLGGLAVAMAAKDTIANLFGSVTVFLDRPFRMGDVITVGGKTGSVEEIGFRSTRIRTFDDTLITIPNQKLTNAEVENVSKRKWRKVKLTVGVTYDTSLAQMEKIVTEIKDILEKHSKVRKDYIVTFSNFGDSALEINIIYKNDTTAYKEHMEIQQEVNFAIMRCIEANDSEFAFPSRTVYLKGEEGEESSKITERTKKKKK